MKNLMRLCLLMSVFALGMGVSVAQDEGVEGEGAALYALLQLIPDNENSRAMVGYSDFTIIDELLPELATLDYETLMADREGFSLWLWNLPMQGLPDLQNFAVDPAGAAAVSGVGMREIEQAIYWGNPPTQGQILRGTFNGDALDAALSVSGFEQAEINGYAAWCHPEGCDKGVNTDFSMIDRLNLFVGTLGRRVPVVLHDDVIVYAPNLAVVEGVLAELDTQGETSLAAASGYRAAAEAVSVVSAAHGDARLRQGVFVPADSLMGDPSILLTPEAQTAPGAQMLPPYELLFVADFATDETQIATVMFVFRNHELAQIGANAIVDRLNLESLRYRRTYNEIFEERGAVIGEPTIIEMDDRAVLTLSFTYSLTEERTLVGDIATVIINMIYARDLRWAAPF